MGKIQGGRDLDSLMWLFERTCWANMEQIEEDQLRLFPYMLKGDTFDWYSRYESSFPTSTWEELKVTFGRKY
jgi:hypothetical protein